MFYSDVPDVAFPTSIKWQFLATLGMGGIQMCTVDPLKANPDDKSLNCVARLLVNKERPECDYRRVVID